MVYLFPFYWHSQPRPPPKLCQHDAQPRTERAVHPSIDGSALRLDATEEQDRMQAPDIATVVSDDDLEACLRVLRTLATPEGGVTEAYRAPRFKPLRKAQQVYLEELRGQLFHGHQPDKYRQGKEKKREKSARQQQDRAMDRAQADKTRMRAERLRMLGELEHEAAAADGEHRAIGFVPDGAVDCDLGLGDRGGRLLLGGGTATEEAATEETGSEGAAMAAPEMAAGGEVAGAAGAAGEAGRRRARRRVRRRRRPRPGRHLRACYTCKARYRRGPCHMSLTPSPSLALARAYP